MAAAESTDLEVGVVEAVDDVPAQLQELVPLQQQAVEEAEGEEESAVGHRPGAAGEAGLRHQLVQTLHVGFYSLERRRGGGWRKLMDTER